MFQRVMRVCYAVCLRLALIAALMYPTGGAAHADSGSTTFSGRATVINATVPVVGNVLLSDTGNLPSSGGAEEASLLTASVPGVLTAEALHAATVGQGDRSRSEASVANVALTAGGHTVTAAFLMSNAMAVCGSGGPSASGNSQVVGLTLDNQIITVGTQPNQKVALPDGTGQIVVNEQNSSRPGNITVNALHVTVNTPTGAVDVIISSAHADITCPPAGLLSCTGGDFVTGGGWIIGASGAKANFAVAGGIKQGEFWGHLEYIDHGTGMKVKGTGVTAYSVTSTATRHIEGTAEIDGTPGTYQVDVADNDDFGGGADSFSMSLSNRYSAGGTLGGGNIQIHKPCR